MNKNAMGEALRRHKARGVDLSIVIGGAEPINSDKPIDGDVEKEREALGLAPDATEIGDKERGKEEEIGKETHNASLLMPGEEMMQGAGEKHLDAMLGKGDKPVMMENKTMETEKEAGHDASSEMPKKNPLHEMLSRHMGGSSLARRAMGRVKEK